MGLFESPRQGKGIRDHDTARGRRLALRPRLQPTPPVHPLIAALITFPEWRGCGWAPAQGEWRCNDAVFFGWNLQMSDVRSTSIRAT